MALILESCSLEEACGSFGASTKLLFELRDGLRNWLKLQPHLPQDVPDHTLEQMILGVKMSLELAKHKLDMFYSIKQYVPEIFSNRDPRRPNYAELYKMIQIVHLPKLTPEKYTVCVIRPVADNYRKLNPTDACRYLYMMADILMSETYTLGYVVIADMTKATLSYITAFSPTLIKKCEVVATEAFALRIKSIHIINSVGLTSQILALAKAALKPKISNRIHVHKPGSYELLQEFIPKSVLPNNYGGDEISLDEIADKWHKKVDDYRDWYLEQDKIKVDERLRPGVALNTDNLFGTAGSFRKLEVD